MVSNPHFTGANLIDSIGKWGGARMKNAITGRAIILISHANVHATRLVTGRNHQLANKWRSKWSPTGDHGPRRTEESDPVGHAASQRSNKLEAPREEQVKRLRYLAADEHLTSEAPDHLDSMSSDPYPGIRRN